MDFMEKNERDPAHEGIMGEHTEQTHHNPFDDGANSPNSNGDTSIPKEIDRRGNADVLSGINAVHRRGQVTKHVDEGVNGICGGECPADQCARGMFGTTRLCGVTQSIKGFSRVVRYAWMCGRTSKPSGQQSAQPTDKAIWPCAVLLGRRDKARRNRADRCSGQARRFTILQDKMTSRVISENQEIVKCLKKNNVS
ncbi:hypothetical protein OROHE_019099 [Orobanche hederae]